ncbi:MAG: hypothetical protein PHN38_06410 [Sulfurospirillaceae bacterium]|nr:hypothetical protein [Sulfurospirillaceae bacterium]MDD3462486.1 hypothetical protein [Sulfurospirillaceae bacterium]
MRYVFIVVAFLFLGCAPKYDALHVRQSKVDTLTEDILMLSSSIDANEARVLANEAINFPIILAQKYDLVSPPTFHNFLINAGIKERGLCYQWSEDLITQLKKHHFKTIDLRWGVANAKEFDEHNSVVVTPKNEDFNKGLLLDPWRDSSRIYWTMVSRDSEYRWSENLQRSRYFGTIK